MIETTDAEDALMAANLNVVGTCTRVVRMVNHLRREP